ncbi:MAG: PDZ domain-containing protein [Verrucomicrobiota bacterium]|jgi:membrane-associated protease RseP (regulator of RpoE activity)
MATASSRWFGTHLAFATLHCLPLTAAKAAPAEPAAATSPEAVSRVALGILVAPLRSDVRAQTPLPDGVGLLVARVVPGSPAATAGIAANDLLFRCNGSDLKSDDDIRKAVTNRKEGDSLELTWLRRGTEMKASVTLASVSLPTPPQAQPDSPEHLQRLEEIFRRLAADPATTSAVHRMLGGSPDDAQGPLPGPLALENHGTSATKEDASGKLRIDSLNGKQSVEIHDHTGKLQFSGPCSTASDRDRIPEPWRSKVSRFLDELKAVSAAAAP